MDLAAIAAIIVAIGGMTVGIMAELRKGRAQKQDPTVEGSGAAICAELRANREAQEKFNTALAGHLGMLPLALPSGSRELDEDEHDKASNGR